MLSYLHRAPSLIVLKPKETDAPKSTIKARTCSGGVPDLKNVLIADNVDAVVVPVRFSFIHVFLKL